MWLPLYAGLGGHAGPCPHPPEAHGSGAVSVWCGGVVSVWCSGVMSVMWWSDDCMTWWKSCGFAQSECFTKSLHALIYCTNQPCNDAPSTAHQCTLYMSLTVPVSGGTFTTQCTPKALDRFRMQSCDQFGHSLWFVEDHVVCTKQELQIRANSMLFNTCRYCALVQVLCKARGLGALRQHALTWLHTDFLLWGCG